jgi:hypothetical protein
MRGRPVRARAAGSETLEKEGQESCRRTGRVKPAGERGAPEWEEGFRAGPSPGRKPVRASGRGALSGNGRGTDTSAAAGPREPTRAGKDTVKGGQRRRSRGLDDGTRSFRSEALKTRTLGVPAGWNRPANRLRRQTRREVEKTWGRGAAGAEACRSRRDEEGAGRARTQGGAGSLPGEGAWNTLKPDRSLEEDRVVGSYWPSSDRIEGLQDDERLRLGVTSERHRTVAIRL